VKQLPSNFANVNHARMHSWKQPVVESTDEGEVSRSKETMGTEPLMGSNSQLTNY